MQIRPDLNDEEGFVTIVDSVLQGVLKSGSPPSLILIKVDGWFGSRWLGFSGKVLGALGVRKNKLTVPPFVPSRIASQRRFDAPSYEEKDCGEPIHVGVPSRAALSRYVAEVAPRASLVWYSGESRITGRGSLMAYLFEDGHHHAWYAAWVHRDSWDLVEAIGVQRDRLPGARGRTFANS